MPSAERTPSILAASARAPRPSAFLLLILAQAAPLLLVAAFAVARTLLRREADPDRRA